LSVLAYRISFGKLLTNNYIKDLTAKTFVVALSLAEVKHYSCSLFALKGYVLKQFAESVSTDARLLQRVYEKPEVFTQFV
jgi:hypothetical protein